MESESDPKDVIVLEAIYKGNNKFDKIQRSTKIEGKELNEILEILDKKGLIRVIEKKGFFSKKKEIILTEKGQRELQERKFELQKNWDQMVTMWKSGDKQKLQQYMDNNKSILPSLMFLGILDIIMFSTMLSFMGMAMSSYIPADQMPAQTDSGADASSDAGDGGYDAGGAGDFDIDIGF